MSFDEVYIKHYNELRRFGRHLNLPTEQCEDLTQEVFLRFYLELEKNVVFDNPRAWLYKVLLNLFKTDLNTDKREINAIEYRLRYDLTDTDLQSEIAKNEKERIVLDTIDHLTKREREILLLYHNGFSYAEMAEIMSINPNSVGKTLVRAIESLKKTLKNQYNEMFE